MCHMGGTRAMLREVQSLRLEKALVVILRLQPEKVLEATAISGQKSGRKKGMESAMMMTGKTRNEQRKVEVKCSK